MFTGIIETMGRVVAVTPDRTNMHFTVESPISHELKIDQSVSHNGACLTVVEISQLPDSGSWTHRVTAIEETLRRTEAGAWKPGTLLNLERCMPMGGRLDGHIVQGHVDAVATCISVEDLGGSWRFGFRYQPTPMHLLVDKGSVTINGVSLTVVEPAGDHFSVAIIPYTWEHTNFHQIGVGHVVNLEFDIIGKYIAQHLAAYGTAATAARH
jgi:riboflavin synthase